MGIEIKDLGKNQVEFSVAVSAEKFSEAVTAAFRKNAKQIAIPGFRKGKAPRNMIERMYGEGVFFDDAVNALLPDIYENAIKENNIDVVSRPEVDVPELSKENGFTAVFKVFVRPVVTVSDYKGITAKKVVYTVKDADIDNEIERIRERNSRIIPIEDRAIENDDIANIDFEGFSDGTAFDGGKGENFDLTIGSGQFIPGFEEQLIGKGAGDDFVVKVKFPEDYQAEDLKGKDAEFKVKINKVTKKELPELDDEFAKDVSDFDTLLEYKNDIKANMAKKLEDRSNQEFENAVVSQICDTVIVDIPDSMIEDRVNMLARDFDNNMMQQGISREMYLQYTGMTEAVFLGQFKKNAEIQVKQMLVLEAIARQEKIDPTEAEISDELDHIASHYGIEKEKITEFIPEEDIKKDIAVKKTVEFLNNASVANEVPEEEKDEKPAKPKKAAAKAKLKKAAEVTEEKPKKTTRKKKTEE